MGSAKAWAFLTGGSSSLPREDNIGPKDLSLHVELYTHIISNSHNKPHIINYNPHFTNGEIEAPSG